MPSLLQQLENNEAVLLMYLADELNAEDRGEVEQMLGRDAGLRVELQRLTTAQDAVMAALASLDELDGPRSSLTAVERRVSRLMHQWQVDRLTAPVISPAGRGIRLPWWAYASASAAALVIGMLVWYGFTDRPSTADSQLAAVISPQPTLPDVIATEIANPQDAHDDVPSSQTIISPEENPGIADAEQQASILNRRSGDGLLASVFLTDATSDSSGQEPNTP